MSDMTYKELADLAEKIWAAVKDNLDDRGCFDGVDNETMDEVTGEQVITIRLLLLEAHGMATRVNTPKR